MRPSATTRWPAIRAERADHYLGGPDRTDPARRFMDLVPELSGS